MRKNRKHSLFLRALGIVLLPRILQAGDLSPKDLFLAAVKAPTAPYQGTRTIITWFGEESHAVEARVYFKPPSLWRQEVLSPKGEIERVVIQNGETEWVWETESQILIKRAGKKNRPFYTALENYNLVSRGKEDVMGEETAIIELVPKSSGSPTRALWVDPRNGIILKIKQTNSDGSLATEAHFTDIDMEPDLPDDLFEPPDAPVLNEEPRKVAANTQELPEVFREIPWMTTLVNGFQLTAATLVPLGDEEAVHFQYNDGLSVLSLFVSPRPIQMNPPSHQVVLTQYEDPGFILSTSAGNVIEWKQGGAYFLLIGELSQAALQTIMEFIRNPS